MKAQAASYLQFAFILKEKNIFRKYESWVITFTFIDINTPLIKAVLKHIQDRKDNSARNWNDVVLRQFCEKDCPLPPLCQAGAHAG